MIKPGSRPKGREENRTTGLRPWEIHPFCCLWRRLPRWGRFPLCLPVETCGTLHSTHSPTASAGGRWCRKAPKGASCRRQLFSVFPCATGAVVWFYQKRRPYMIVKAVHRRALLMSDASHLIVSTSSNLKPLISNLSF